MSTSFDLDSAKGIFFAEARQLLEEVEGFVLELEITPDDPETMNAAFRAVHTIKGSAGVFGFTVICHFVHDLETVLDRVRSNEIGFDAGMGSLVLECGDHISNLVDSLEQGCTPEETPDELREAEANLSGRLSGYLGKPTGDRLPQKQDSGDSSPYSESGGTDRMWHISIRLGKSTLSDGFDPLPIFGFLTTFGDIDRMIPVLDSLPKFSELDPEGCFLGFEMGFFTDRDLDAIEEAFEFLSEETMLTILPHDCSAEEFDTLVEQLPEPNERAIELLAWAGFSRPAENSLSPAVEPNSLPASAIKEAMSVKAAEDADAVHSVPVEAKKKTNPKPASSSQFIRVPSDKLDDLINLVGELVIANAGTVEQAKQNHSTEMIESTLQVAGLIEEIRDGALGLRMVQIGETFQRFNRVVRDISKSLGKKINLEIRGKDTELDKSVVEKIADPLMHLIRNALDHGLEMPEEREQAGKPAEGTLGLYAFHDSGHIVIQVRDDGRGLAREKILNKATEKGIVAPGQILTDDEVNMLVFAPGFSTATEITDISGRGVGMDVVRRNIEALRGTIQVRTEPGVGTTFEIRLPLTLAIIDGFMIGVGDEMFVIPLGYVRECLELPSELIQQDARMDLHYDLRGEFLPCVRLRKVFNSDGPRPRRENIIVVSFGGVRAGIVADQLHGESQTVIKPLGALFEQNKAISGATIMGSGDVALIIDVPKLVGEVADSSGGEEGNQAA